MEIPSAFHAWLTPLVMPDLALVTRIFIWYTNAFGVAYFCNTWCSANQYMMFCKKVMFIFSKPKSYTSDMFDDIFYDFRAFKNSIWRILIIISIFICSHISAFSLFSHSRRRCFLMDYEYMDPEGWMYHPIQGHSCQLASLRALWADSSPLVMPIGTRDPVLGGTWSLRDQVFL